MTGIRYLTLALIPFGSALAADARFQGLPVLFTELPGHASHFLARGSGLTATFAPDSVCYGAGSSVVRLRFPGANQRLRIEGSTRLSGRVNILRGAPEDWRTGLPVYSGLVYRGIYPGIDMRYAGLEREMKSEFVVAPGADPALIRVRYEGAGAPEIAPDGSLLLKVGRNEIREQAPVAFQEVDGHDVQVPVSFEVSESGDVGFRLGPYDRGRELIVDPVISYATLLGGTGIDSVNAIAVDANGSVYVAGHTDAYDLPLAGPLQSGSKGGTEAFVAKLNAAGNGLIYCTYLGGMGDDRAFGIAVDGSGSAYVTGRTQSPNFPVRNAYQLRLGGYRNAFVAKLNPAGNALIFSTYLGGAARDSGNAIALDSSGNVYVAGESSSVNFPATGYQKTNRGGIDGFVVKLTGSGQVVYSTLIGGSGDDRMTAVAVDSSGSASVTGSTWSADFPVTSAQTKLGGGQDAFVARLNPAGTALTMSRYLGGSGQAEEGRAIAVDNAGYTYVAGNTNSADFPLQSASQSSLRGGADGFVAKIAASGSFVYSTLLGGSGVDSVNAIAAGAQGDVYVAGDTLSRDFPVVSPQQSANAGDYDAFLARLDPNGGITYASYYGGNGSDSASGIAVDNAGDVYIAGQTQSSNLPLVNAFQSANLGNNSGFIAKFSFTSLPNPKSISPASGSGSAQVFQAVIGDERGGSFITSASLMIQTGTSAVNACGLTYTAATNTLSLLTDSGALSSASLIPGGSGTMENSQCVLDAAGSAVSVSSGGLTLTISLAFKSGLAGNRDVYVAAANTYGGTGWRLLGSFTVLQTAAAPAAVSVTPSSGSGASQAFAFTYSDTTGYTDVKEAQLLVAGSLTLINGCYASYVRSTNTFWLANDAGTFQGPLAAGSAGTLQNSQCTLKGADSSASGSGSSLTVRFSLDFAAGFSGDKNIYGLASDVGGADSGWQKRGTWTVPAAYVNQPPSVVGVTPSSGSGKTQTFTFTLSDPNGAGDLLWAELLVGPALRAGGACYLYSALRSNQIWLLGDAGTWLGPVTLGGSGTLQNSLCSLDAATSSASASGNNKSVGVALTFQSGFSGDMGVYGLAGDGSNVSSGWRMVGGWTVTSTSVNQPPVAVSVTPSSGSGTTQAFAFQFSDPNGYADIVGGELLIAPALSTANSCYLYFSRGAQLIYLLGDSGTWAGSVTAGSSGTVENSRCTLNAAGSSFAGSGNTLTITAALTFKAAFAGDKGVWMLADDRGSLSTGWQQRGSWNVPATTGNQPPAFVSVSPSSGSGTSQTFSFQFSDTNGYADVASAEILVGPLLKTTGTCYLYFSRSASSLWLASDGGAFLGPVKIGSSSTLQNSQCLLNAAASSVSGSGNTLSLNISLSFTPAYKGGAGLYASVYDAAGTGSGWAQRGNWTVP